MRQRWHRAAGRAVPVYIGVNDAGDRFGAHAWLEGERGGQFAAILTWP